MSERNSRDTAQSQFNGWGDLTEVRTAINSGSKLYFRIYNIFCRVSQFTKKDRKKNRSFV